MDTSKVSPALVKDMGDKTNLLEELQRRVADIEPVPGEPQFFSNPETLMRYLKAREWDVDEAEKQLRKTIEWRTACNPRDVECKWCHERPGFHCMRQVGFDELHRPVIYSCFAQASYRKNTVEDALAHVTYLVENAKHTMPPGIHNWVFIMDCTGMSGMKACSPKLGYEVSQVLSTHYPERLGLTILVNQNAVFQAVWNVMKTFLHPNTASKVQMARSKEKTKELFDLHFSEDLSKWLIEEIRLNRERPIKESQKVFWSAPPDILNGHDPRGCSDYVKNYIDTYASSKRDGTTHKPHPNIIDMQLGQLSAPVPGSPSPSREPENEGDDEDVDIDEEFLIPQGAEQIHM